MKPDYQQFKKEAIERWEKHKREQISKMGIDPSTLTQEQIELILEPSEAPENFYCDGEISHEEASARWFKRLRQTGLKIEQILKVINSL